VRALALAELGFSITSEVTERATRRVFSAQYKLKILAEYERREGIAPARSGPIRLCRRTGGCQ
jgi:hypothetical protein